MTPHRLSKIYNDRIFAFLRKLAVELRKKQIVSDEPFQMFDFAYEDYEWWMVVYPWEKVDPVPGNALDLMFKLAHTSEDNRLFATFALSLATNDGVPVDDLDMGDPVNVTLSLIKLDEQLRDFEMDSTIIDIASRSAAYISKVRRERPKGPREWSPRWDSPSMGATKKKPEPIMVNLVMQKDWEAWDTAGELSERINELSDEDLKVRMSEEH